MSENQLKKEVQLATKVTLVGALLDFILGALKVVVGLFSNSYGLVSDGIHSFSDLFTDFFVLVFTRLSREKPDAEHPYGHARFETMATIVIGVVLFSVACILCYESVRRLSNLEQLQSPGWLTLIIAGISIASKEWIYRYTKHAATEINSSLLLANAWHSRSDAFSSVAVLIGLIGAMLGYLWMDLAAAVFVALMIAKIAWELISKSLKELVDAALPEKETNAIKDHIINSEGIVDSHSLRSRLHGGQAFLDIHVQVEGNVSVSEGHYLGEKLTQSLITNFPIVSDVVVHIDPELDLDDNQALLTLPLRQEILETLLDRWSGVISKEQIHSLNLHYLDNSIQAEIFLDNSIINNQLKDTLNNLAKDLSWLKKLTIYGTF